MGEERTEGGRLTRGVVVAFAALAVLVTVVPVWSEAALDSALPLQSVAGSALSSGLAGVALLLMCFARGRRLPGATQWAVVLVLLLPVWLQHLVDRRYVGEVFWLHAPPAGVALLLRVAAPIWLALLSAMELIRERVARAVVAASICGIGAVCLVSPVNYYNVGLKQTPTALVELLLSIVVVYTWAYAKPRLAPAGALTAAGCFLLLSAVGDAGFWLLSERRYGEPVDWHGVALPLLVQAGVVAGSSLLWFWLLERMSLAAFSIGPLAGWTAYLVLVLATGDFLWWRLDAAIAIGIVAIVVALRARVSDEEMVELGLRGG